MIVIRRPARPRVEIVAAPAVAARVEVPRLTPAEERERLLRNRDRRVRGEVEAIFREHGAKIFSGDPIKHARGQHRATEGS